MTGASEANPRTSVRSRLEAKVLVLEGWALSGRVPEGMLLPDGPVALRKWTCTKPKLEAWGSPNVVSDVKNKDLRRRFDKALIILRGENEGLGGASKSSVLQAQVVGLAEQVDDLIEEVQAVSRLHEQAEHKLALSEAKVAELTAILSKVVPAGIVR